MKEDVLRVFLLGYGGANNTGSEIRILTIINDVKAALGESVYITLGTVDRAKTLKIVNETECLKVVELPYLFPSTVWCLAKAHDIVMLVEGSTFKDNWSSALLYLFLWGAWAAKRHGNLSIAYAVDVGHMGKLNQRLTRWVCQKMDLIITRTEAARQELRALGVQRDIVVTTDTAFQFEHSAVETSETSVVGVAPVEFYQWPVRFRFWGPKEQCYHWPYFFSWDEGRAKQSSYLVDAWAQLIRHIVEDRRWRVRLIAMEELDSKICTRIMDRLSDRVRAQVETSFAGVKTPQTIVAELRRLKFLVTSRYHACVLSMNGEVPQMALYHDERLISIYQELGLTDYAIKHDEPDLHRTMQATFATLVKNELLVKARLHDRLYSYYLPHCMRNREVLAAWHQSVASREVAATR